MTIKSSASAWILITAAVSWRQLPYRNPADFTDLFARVSGSEYVIIATVGKSESFPGRPSKEAIDEARRKTEAARTQSGGTVFVPDGYQNGATVYTLAVTRVLCTQAHFLPGSRQPAELTGPVYILLPWREEMTRDANVEHFQPGPPPGYMTPSGLDYLIFLEKDPTQDQFGSLYQNIDTKRTYYRGHLRSRGVIQLTDDPRNPQTAETGARVLSSVEALCDAVKPADYSIKTANLTALMNSTDDPGLRKSAEAALGALKRAELPEKVQRYTRDQAPVRSGRGKRQ